MLSLSTLYSCSLCNVQVANRHNSFFNSNWIVVCLIALKICSPNIFEYIQFILTSDDCNEIEPESWDGKLFNALEEKYFIEKKFLTETPFFKVLSE